MDLQYIMRGEFLGFCLEGNVSRKELYLLAWLTVKVQMSSGSWQGQRIRARPCKHPSDLTTLAEVGLG